MIVDCDRKIIKYDSEWIVTLDNGMIVLDNINDDELRTLLLTSFSLKICLDFKCFENNVQLNPEFEDYQNKLNYCKENNIQFTEIKSVMPKRRIGLKVHFYGDIYKDQADNFYIDNKRISFNYGIMYLLSTAPIEICEKIKIKYIPSYLKYISGPDQEKKWNLIFKTGDISYPFRYEAPDDLIIRILKKGTMTLYHTQTIRSARPDLIYLDQNIKDMIKLIHKGETEFICNPRDGKILVEEFGFTYVGDRVYQKKIG